MKISFKLPEPMWRRMSLWQKIKYATYAWFCWFVCYTIVIGGILAITLAIFSPAIALLAFAYWVVFK